MIKLLHSQCCPGAGGQEAWADCDATQKAVRVNGAQGGGRVTHAEDPDTSRPEGSAEAQRAGGLLLDLAACYSRLAQQWGRAWDLNATDAQIMLLLSRAEDEGEPLSPGRLARQLARTPAATSAAISRLEQRGWILRFHDRSDRRVVSLNLLPPGRDRVRPFTSALHRALGAAVGRPGRLVDHLEGLVSERRRLVKQSPD